MPTYANEEQVRNLAGNPEEEEFPTSRIQEIMTEQDKNVDHELPRVYAPTDIGYQMVVQLASYLAAIEIRKEWFDIGNKIPIYEQKVAELREQLKTGLPEADYGGNLIFSDIPEIDYIYYSDYFLGGKKHSW